jgi:hypothetical protein
MRVLWLTLCLLFFTLPSQSSPLLVHGWNWIKDESDVTAWEEHASVIDEAGFDCAMQWIENTTPEQQDRIIAEDAKRHFQIILILDGARDVTNDLSFIAKVRNATNADGEPIIHSCILGWDRVNNIHPDRPFDELNSELKVSASLAQTIRPDIPIWLTVSYTPGENLEEWYSAMRDVPHTGIWLWNVWGWQSNLQTPMAWCRSKGEFNVMQGCLYGWKYWQSRYREDLIRRGAAAWPEYWQTIGTTGYAGVAYLENIWEHDPFGSMRLLNEQGQPNQLFRAIKESN